MMAVVYIIYCQHVCVNEINNINTVNTMDQQFWQIIALPLYTSTTFLFHPFPYLAIACQSGDLFFAHHLQGRKWMEKVSSM
jgi:hypothetical protein